MSVDLTSPITGAAVGGLTNPTYTLLPDSAPSNNSKQWAATGLGGTQTGVSAHSTAKPFTISVFRPQQLKTLPQPNPVTGIVKNIPNNTYKLITRKGAVPNGQNYPVVARITTTIEVPAGTDTYEPEELAAMLSLHIGALHQQSTNIGSMMVSGLL